jgi:hypothetical protein
LESPVIADQPAAVKIGSLPGAFTARHVRKVLCIGNFKKGFGFFLTEKIFFFFKNAPAFFWNQYVDRNRNEVVTRLLYGNVQQE